MRRLFLELYHKQMIFPSTPITSFSPFLSYIIVMPLMLCFEKDFSCHSHLGPIWIPPLFLFPPAPFPRNENRVLSSCFISFDCSCLFKSFAVFRHYSFNGIWLLAILQIKVRIWFLWAKHVPITIFFLLGTLSLCGIPPLAYFWSKDEILNDSLLYSPIFAIIALSTAGLTAFYMFRIYLLTFEGHLNLYF